MIILFEANMVSETIFSNRLKFHSFTIICEWVSTHDSK